MKKLIKGLLLTAPVLMDEAWGTKLQARGLEPRSCPNAWNLSHPELVEEVARSYVEAGSQVILTNTFCANRIGLARHGLATKAQKINRSGIEISCWAVSGHARVFASMEPTGKFITGDVSEEEVATVFEEQSAPLALARADAIVI